MIKDVPLMRFTINIIINSSIFLIFFVFRKISNYVLIWLEFISIPFRKIFFAYIPVILEKVLDTQASTENQ